jgi:hypothetical protein
MTKQEKLESLTNQLAEKYGQKTFTRINMIAEERFGQKNVIKMKFFQSVIEGYIKPDELWTSDENIESLRTKIEKTPDNKKEEVILEILETYDTKDPKVKELMKKYSSILEKHIKPEKIKISIA